MKSIRQELGEDNPLSDADEYQKKTEELKEMCIRDRVKAAINKLNASYGQKAVNESLKEVNSVLNRLAPVIPVSRQKEFTAVSADLKNCRMTRYDPFIINVYDIRVK